MSELTLKRLINLNLDFLQYLENSFNKPTNISQMYIGERRINNNLESRNSLFPSKKSNGLICLESNLERSHALSLERNHDIQDYRTQSIKIYLSEKNYVIPDFLVRIRNSFEVHEIKANLSTINENQIIRFNLIQELLEYYSISFRKFDCRTLPNYDQTNVLNFCYQKIIRNLIDENILEIAEKVLNQNRFYNINDIYKILLKNNIPTLAGDYLIFYKKILGY